ncbi:hypothetical protein HBA53_23815 (plasmid) [Rhodococcus pyridinivorans]|uniref:hypothetical protein n=1 Tax=Rhodococcus TaxID=1827 RepID=UPI001C30D307|nr:MULTISPECIES: hypothetical protein [Rhodococcus]MBX4170940.1 hypothetical protein [Rhodococcus sp. DMU2021]QXF84142.1 hypothetical protein HBA53_23815 [Rhodococcus pyridinivorans]
MIRTRTVLIIGGVAVALTVGATLVLADDESAHEQSTSPDAAPAEPGPETYYESLADSFEVPSLELDEALDVAERICRMSHFGASTRQIEGTALGFVKAYPTKYAREYRAGPNYDHARDEYALSVQDAAFFASVTLRDYCPYRDQFGY